MGSAGQRRGAQLSSRRAPRPVGVLGGTFDPVHVGHLRAALEIRDALDLAEIRLIPSHLPPHRPQPVANAEQRLGMLRLAVRGVPGLTVDARELQRAGPSYTVDTLIDLRAQFGRRPICLLLGDDAFRGLPGWHRWQDVFELAHVVVMQRRASADDPLSPVLAQAVHGRWAGSGQALAATPAGQVWRQPLPPLEISATHIRAVLRAGRSARFLVADSCLRYIRRHHLYLE